MREISLKNRRLQHADCNRNSHMNSRVPKYPLYIANLAWQGNDTKVHIGRKGFDWIWTHKNAIRGLFPPVCFSLKLYQEHTNSCLDFVVLKSRTHLFIFLSEGRQIDMNLRDMEGEQWASQCCRILYHTNHIFSFHFIYLLNQFHCQPCIMSLSDCLQIKTTTNFTWMTSTSN